MALQTEWVINIQKKLDQGGQVENDEPWAKHSIYKVPSWMKDEQQPSNKNISGYIPEIISLGPYHHGLSHLQQMETHKWRVLNHMLKREGQNISLYLTAIKEIEHKARQCYDSQVELNINQFVEKLVLDGCFVLEFLRGRVVGYYDLKYGFNDPIFCKDSVCHVIGRDLMKLENQIPLFVLHKLLEVQYERLLEIEEVPKLVLSVLTPKWVTLNEPMTEDALEIMTDVVSKGQGLEHMVHPLDVFWRSLMYKPESHHTTWCGIRPIWIKLKEFNINLVRRKEESEHFMANCISDLREAGITFKPRRKLPFWELHFSERSGVLEIHPFKIDDTTETCFRNLIAYEQCHMNNSWDMVITNYVAFMDNLIDTAADVAYLHDAGIIVHYLGSDSEVADLFNRLVKKIYVSKKTGRLHDVYQKLNNYCGHRRNRWKASLQNEYLSNPWVIISIIAALLLFLLTAVQTGYTVYAYYKPPS